jgi:hypothetical protein
MRRQSPTATEHDSSSSIGQEESGPECHELRQEEVDDDKVPVDLHEELLVQRLLSQADADADEDPIQKYEKAEQL